MKYIILSLLVTSVFATNPRTPLYKAQDFMTCKSHKLGELKLVLFGSLNMLNRAKICMRGDVGSLNNLFAIYKKSSRSNIELYRSVFLRCSTDEGNFRAKLRFDHGSMIRFYGNINNLREVNVVHGDDEYQVECRLH